MNRSLRNFSLVALSLLLSNAIVLAQGTGQLNGRVNDESGAVLPGVTVTATQTDTGVTRTVATDETGAWVMLGVPTGPYRLEMSLQGFRTYVQSGIVLQVGTSPVINTVLAVGNLEETVAVEAAAPLVDVRSAGISEVVEQERIVELPLQGRNVTDLIVLAGSAFNTGRVFAHNRSDSVGISVAGGLRTGVAYILDGASHSDTYDNSNLPFPFPDALQEFSVATSGLSAENGMHSGASMTAVTKSGTNALHGNAFEFFRDSRFNAPAYFAAVGPDGKKKGDGLNRNQFGGTLGGPVVRDKLFFFGGYQRTRTSQLTTDNVAFVPTAAMLAGDFTAGASPACNAGRQVTLAAPFVNNRINPALYSQPAVKIANSGWLPTSTDPCGEIRFNVPLDDNNEQYVTRVDYQWSAGHSLFGRYIDHFERRLPTLERTHNILTVGDFAGANSRKRAQTTAFGDTLVFGANTVNAVRVTWVRTSTRINQPTDKFFDGPSLGIPIYTYVPGVMGLSVTGAFASSSGGSIGVKMDSRAYQVQDDLSRVWGRHQLSVGVNTVYSTLDSADYARAAGTFTFNGRATGLPLTDFLTGRTSSFIHGAPSILDNHSWYLGLYAQDAWRATDRVTLNLGLRWEPYFGTYADNGAVSNFVLDNFRDGIKSTVYINAPAGLIYPGDQGFPSGQTGLHKQWWNLSPRLGVAWDPNGDGRLAVRSSYGINYDFPTAILQQVSASAAPWNNRIDLSGDLPFEDPYRGVPGGQQHPVENPPPRSAVFPSFGSFAAIDPHINSTRIQSWNVTVERQLGAAWQISASYLGSYMDRLWGAVALNPGVFLGLGPCTLQGVFYPTCTTTGNLNARRALTLENPQEGRLLSYVSEYSDVGEQSYRGLKLAFQRRAAAGVSLSGNYTLSHCETDTQVTGSFFQFGAAYTNPSDPSFDRGNCGQNRRQIANLSVGVQTPQFANPTLRVVASDWRVSGIVNANTGSWLTVITGRDPALTGISDQRVNQVNDNPYGAKALTTYLNPAAFAYPASGALGDEPARSIEGPGFWKIDVSLARVLPVAEGKTLELRVEAFNLLNNFNWGDPATNLDAGTFGRITTQAGASRVMQFAVKYGF